MATRTDYAIQASLDHYYLNQPIANIGDAVGLQPSANAGNLYAALLTDGVEASYGNYARVAIPRTAEGFVRNANIVSNLAQLNFPKSNGVGSQSANQIAIYDQAAGGNQLHLQNIGYVMPTSINVQPIIEAGALTVTGS